MQLSLLSWFVQQGPEENGCKGMVDVDRQQLSGPLAACDPTGELSHQTDTTMDESGRLGGDLQSEQEGQPMVDSQRLQIDAVDDAELYLSGEAENPPSKTFVLPFCLLCPVCL